MSKRVSVIIPTHNREKYLARAIESVLAQTFSDYELIVVDDGSTDSTPDILKRFEGKLRVVRQNNQGSGAARNRGIEESKGEYIAFLDSDDFWVPEKLAEQVKVLDAYPKIGIVYARMPIINEKNEKLGMKPAGVSGKNLKELFEVWGDLPTSTVMTRRVCFDKAGLFDPELKTMQDIDMWLRIARHYDLYEIEGKVLAYYFRHSEQITASKIKVYRGLLKLYHKILRTFDEAPKEIFAKRIVLHQYVLARVYFSEKLYGEAFRNVAEVILRKPLVGVVFFEEKDNVLTKAFKLIKPYGFITVCFFMMAAQSVINLFGKPTRGPA